MTGKFRRKPLVVDAIKFDCNNVEETRSFAEAEENVKAIYDEDGKALLISGDESTILLRSGDWLVRGNVPGFPGKEGQGLYPYNDEAFNRIFEPTT